MRKLYVFTLVSAAVLAVVIGNAFHMHKQFYPSMVALSQSRLFNVLMWNSFMVALMLAFHSIRFVFLGKLRDQEVEKAMESTTYFLMEIFLTLAVFGERFTVEVVALFTLCVFWKIFHWLAQSRLDFIEQTPGIGSGQLRLAIFLVVLIFVDSTAGQTLISDMYENGPSVKLLLLENFIIMAVLATAALLRLVLHLVDARQNRRWEAKGAARFYLEIVSDVAQCLICIVFFFIITAYYGLPINLLREMVYSVGNLNRTVKNFLNYRRLAANLDTKFPNATEEEIQSDPQCSICFDELQVGDAKRLQCSHMFHKHCLRQWLERQTTCPYCRTNIDTNGLTNNAPGAWRNAANRRQNAAAAAPAAPAAPAAAPAPAAEGDAAAAAAAAAPAATPAAQAPAAPQDGLTPAAEGGGLTLVGNKQLSNADVKRAYRLYCLALQQQGAAAAAATSSSSSSTSSSSAPPVPFAVPHAPMPVLSTPAPTGQLALDEIEIYRDFHKDMHDAYSALHRRIAAVKRPADATPSEATEKS